MGRHSDVYRLMSQGQKKARTFAVLLLFCCKVLSWYAVYKFGVLKLLGV